MDRTSYFIKDKALFGSFPTQEGVEELELEGVRYFVNLTHDHERKIIPYKTKYNYISFPIVDRRVPRDWRAFARFIIRISDIIKSLKDDELIFIHCKGGHGRSGVVVACILCYMFNMSPTEALERTTNSHSKRSIMREKWRKLGAPQTKHQKNFVYKFFEKFVFYRYPKEPDGRFINYRDYTEGFSNYSDYPVEYNDTIYPNSRAAISTVKLLMDLKENRTIPLCRTPDRKVSKNYYKELCVKMYDILRCKFDQHPELKHNLMNTGLRKIVYRTSEDSFWGDGGDGTGHNYLGKTLYRLREYYYRYETCDRI